MEYFHVSKQLFPFLFGANVLVMIALTRLNIKMVQTYEPKTILSAGMTIQLAAGTVLLLLSFSPNLPAVFFAMTIYVGILGIIFGNGIALALEFFKNDSGVANSVIGVTEFTIAGTIGFIASSIHTGTLIPIFPMMAATPLLALFSLRVLRR